jgi:hypothetical protein
MTAGAPYEQGSAHSMPTGATAAGIVRDRLETERVVTRRRQTSRVILALIAAVLLVLLAVGLRRDQVARDSALQDLRPVADAMERWVHVQGALPNDLSLVLAAEGKTAADRFVYIGRDRRLLAYAGYMPVVLVYGRRPVSQTFRENGRPTLLCKRTSFQLKWMTEGEFGRQRRLEDELLAKLRETSHLGTHP